MMMKLNLDEDMLEQLAQSLHSKPVTPCNVKSSDLFRGCGFVLRIAFLGDSI